MKRLRIALVAAGAVLVIAGLAAPAGAHAAYKSSDPPDDGQVSAPPGEVTATFTEPLAEGSYLEITDPCGERVDGGDVRIVGYDMSVSMSGAAVGRYTVFYRAFSRLDPHVTEGTFGFTATSGDACAGEEKPGEEAGPEEDPSAGGSGPKDPGSATVESGPGGDDSTQTVRSGGGARESASTGGSARPAGEGQGRDGGPSADEQDVSELAADREEEAAAPSVWEGIRLEPFLTGLLLAAIIGAAGGKMYAGIMGPRA